MRRELQKQYAASNNNETVAVRRAACWWMTGDATGCNSGQMVSLRPKCSPILPAGTFKADKSTSIQLKPTFYTAE